MLENDNVNKFSGETDTETNNTETEEEIENEEDQRCLTPSNTYLEVSFEHKPDTGTTPKATNFFKDFVHHSTPNNGMYFNFVRVSILKKTIFLFLKSHEICFQICLDISSVASI